MAETNGSGAGNRTDGYRPRHAAEQLDDGLMEALAEAADQYRYRQMYEQYDAEFAIARARVFAAEEIGEDDELIRAQRQRIAESIGRQASAKAYADGLRAQLYYVPPDGEQPYHGRHRLEDRQETGQAEEVQPHKPRHEARQEPAAPPEEEEKAPEPPRFTYVPEQGRLRHVITDDRPPIPPQPLPQEEPAEEPHPPVPAQKERMGLFARMRHAWYAGAAAISTFFAHPEKGARRRAIARTVAVLGGVAAVLVAAELGDRAPDHVVQPPAPPEPAGPSPNTGEFFDTLTPYQYNGEAYEWTAVANHLGAAEATPKLLRLIEHARDSGLAVDTWGDPDCGHWGINSVTICLPDGTQKSYYDTPRKLAILKWFAGGAGPDIRQ